MSQIIADRVQEVRTRIAEAAERSGRKPSDVLMVAVTKTVPPDRIYEAIQAGLRTFGENRVQEAVSKLEAMDRLASNTEWHLIGHLQTNKARIAAETFSLIESVDSVRLATKLDAIAGRLGIRMGVLVEVNVAGESSKSGYFSGELEGALQEMLRLPNLDVRGLMTVAPLVADPQEARPVFRRLRETRDTVVERLQAPNVRELSMGMSGDYPIAIEEGATIVRIGRALFGERRATEGAV